MIIKYGMVGTDYKGEVALAAFESQGRKEGRNERRKQESKRKKKDGQSVYTAHNRGERKVA